MLEQFDKSACLTVLRAQQLAISNRRSMITVADLFVALISHDRMKRLFKGHLTWKTTIKDRSPISEDSTLKLERNGRKVEIAYSRQVTKCLLDAQKLAGKSDVCPEYLAIILSDENVLEPSGIQLVNKQELICKLIESAKRQRTEPTFLPIVKRAVTVARKKRDSEVNVCHLFCALLELPDSILASVLSASISPEIDVEKLKNEILNYTSCGSVNVVSYTLKTILPPSFTKQMNAILKKTSKSYNSELSAEQLLLLALSELSEDPLISKMLKTSNCDWTKLCSSINLILRPAC